MATNFTYVALTASGKKVTDVMVAETVTEVMNVIQERGMHAISVKEGISASKLQLSLGNRKKQIDSESLYLACKQFYTMLHSGISILDTIETVSNQTKNKKLSKILASIHAKVFTGVPFSKALLEYNYFFPSLFISMVETGEITGNLEVVMDRLATYYENDYKTVSQVKSAMIYPLILVSLTVVMVIFMMVFIMPTFVDMFEGSGTELPGITKAMVAASNFLVNRWYVLIIAIMLIVIGSQSLLKLPKSIILIDKIKLKLPIVKMVVTTGTTFRTCRSLAIMLSSGVSLFDGLDICAKVSGNYVAVQSIKTIKHQISEGMSFGNALSRAPIFPGMMVAMTKIGEQAGVLDNMLDDVADYYQEELNTAVRNLVAILEPLMIIVMALGIGTVVIAMLMPMFTMMEGIG